MSVGGDGPTTPVPPDPSSQPPAGWYPDPWTPARRRYWNGTSWTFDTNVAVPFDHPAPEDPTPLGEGHGLPAPVYRRPGAAVSEAPTKPPQKAWKWMAAVVVGLLVGVVGVYFSTRSPSEPAASSSTSAPQRTPGTGTAPPSSVVPDPASPGNDPSANALRSLVVLPEDVPATASVVVFEGGIGLNQATLDLCNGTYPSESRRSARIQDAVLDSTGSLVLSTEAVLYGDSGGTTQAFAELRSVVAACPPTPVQGPSGQAASTTTFNPAPDAGWPQTPSVNRLAFDLTTDDGTGRTRRTVAVYLQRGRALLGVYFSRPDGPQLPVEGKTTIEGIVGVFAARLAALPTSVVGA